MEEQSHGHTRVHPQPHPASTPKKQRKVDTSNAYARRAVRDILVRFDDWRKDLARFSAYVERCYTDAERATILERCQAIDEEMMEACTELTINLADAPPRVAGNSRIVDVERALDNTGASLKALRVQLSKTAK